MAIEFNCPFCTALIRVPDSAGGGKGKCPRCARRIAVPKVSTKTAPKPPDPEIAELFATANADVDQPPVTDAVDSVTFATAEPEFDSNAPVDIFAPAPRNPGQFPVQPTLQTLRSGSIASKLKRKKSGNAWLIPMGFGLILCGAVGWYVWKQYETERLVGDLIAETASDLDLTPAEISGSLFQQSPGELKPTLERLETAPVRIPSTLMFVKIGATKRAMTVRVNAGPKTKFYRVDISDDPGLIAYRKKRSFELEELRESELSRAATEFVNEYQQVIEKKVDPSALNEYRNSLALPALVRGLGHQVVAVYGQTIYQCVYEDGKGGLYFLLPPEAQGFELIGRQHKDGTVTFPGKYRVKVTGQLDVPPKDATDAKADSPKSKSNEPSEEGDSTKMDDSMDDGAKKKPSD